MKKFLLAFLVGAIAFFAFAQETETTPSIPDDQPEIIEPTAGALAGVNAVSLSQRAHNLVQHVTDEATQKRIKNLLHESNFVLKKVGINEKFFDDTTLGISNYVILSTIALLAIYGVAAILVVKILLFVAGKISKVNRLHSLSEALEAINSPLSKLIYVNAIYVSFWRFALSVNYAHIYETFFTIVFTALWTWLVVRVFDVLAGKTERYTSTHAGVREVFSLFKRFLRWTIVIIAMLVLAGKLGFDVKVFIASLGIGGAALAFASKDTIANFFGSVSLIMDAPFRIGERIQVSGKLDGTVESIGIRSTRIRNLDNTVSILPNSYLANEYIVNVSEWKKRKVETVVGLVYSTTPDQMRAVLSDIRRMLVTDAAIADDGISVTFKEFAASSLNVYVVYFTKSTDTTIYNETLERVNLSLMDIVSKNGSDMAFPTQTVYQYNMPDITKP